MKNLSLSCCKYLFNTISTIDKLDNALIKIMFYDAVKYDNIDVVKWLFPKTEKPNMSKILESNSYRILKYIFDNTDDIYLYDYNIWPFTTYDIRIVKLCMKNANKYVSYKFIKSCIAHNKIELYLEYCDKIPFEYQHFIAEYGDNDIFNKLKGYISVPNVLKEAIIHGNISIIKNNVEDILKMNINDIYDHKEISVDVLRYLHYRHIPDNVLDNYFRWERYDLISYLYSTQEYTFCPPNINTKKIPLKYYVEFYYYSGDKDTYIRKSINGIISNKRYDIISWIKRNNIPVDITKINPYLYNSSLKAMQMIM